MLPEHLPVQPVRLPDRGERRGRADRHHHPPAEHRPAHPLQHPRPRARAADARRAAGAAPLRAHRGARRADARPAPAAAVRAQRPLGGLQRRGRAARRGPRRRRRRRRAGRRPSRTTGSSRSRTRAGDRRLHLALQLADGRTLADPTAAAHRLLAAMRRANRDLDNAIRTSSPGTEPTVGVYPFRTGVFAGDGGGSRTSTCGSSTPRRPRRRASTSRSWPPARREGPGTTGPPRWLSSSAGGPARMARTSGSGSPRARHGDPATTTERTRP